MDNNFKNIYHKCHIHIVRKDLMKNFLLVFYLGAAIKKGFASEVAIAFDF